MEVHAYYSLGLAGLEIEVDPRGESVTYRYVYPNGRDRERIARVHSNKGKRAYFIAHGKRVYLDQCIRTEL